MPNGRYVVRVVASDAPSNSPATALDRRDGEHDVRHRQHAAGDHRHLACAATARGTIIAFDVRDENSAVQKAEYSLDGDRWQTIYPRDGIADSRVEQFELVLEGEAAARGVILRATDALNNVASARGEAPAGVRPSLRPAPSALGARHRRRRVFRSLPASPTSGTGSTAGRASARASARAVPRPSSRTISHTMLTATCVPTGVCAGANRDCFTRVEHRA